MQFHLDGYRGGDPLVRPAHPDAGQPGLPATVDVLVVGAGPAGLVLAAQLANVPDVHAVVVDRGAGPLQVGQADGIACRTVEMMEAFGLADQLIREGYQVNEVGFWRPDGAGGVTRTGRVDDVEPDLSEMPHLIVNQARVLDHLRGHLARSARRSTPHYGLELVDLHVDPDGPVIATVRDVDDGVTSTISARYVVGCDGARSAVRSAIGLALVGDSTDRSWGVLDVLAVTDFPDIRLKAVVASDRGSLVVIPREGGYLVRLYVELDGERNAVMLRERSATPEKLVEIVNRVLHPYTIDVRHVGWWTVYEIGQRLCERFDDVPPAEIGARPPRVFIAGDACHTHSAKAGQGMNVAMADAWNLGWKLAAVVCGTARPELLRTYSAERQAVARDLIDFDRRYSALISTHRPGGSDPAFQQYFRAQGRYTAGVAVRYGRSVLTSAPDHQHLATGFPVGMRFHSAPVVRLADAKPVQLGHVARADGAWRLYAFADGAARGCGHSPRCGRRTPPRPAGSPRMERRSTPCWTCGRSCSSRTATSRSASCRPPCGRGRVRSS